jgi:hypothetical protein
MAHLHQPPSTTRIVIGPRDEERRALAAQWLRPVEPDRPDNDVADEPEEWKVFLRLADVFRTPLRCHSFAQAGA